MQMNEMRNGDHVRDMVRDARYYIAQNAPEKSGQMIRNLNTETPLQETAQGFRKGLGPRSKVGSENFRARGTIYNFLKDYPQFLRGGTGGPDKRLSHKAGAGKFVWVGPWRSLSKNAKAMLQSKREEGLYGGSDQGFATGKSPWFFVQEGTLDGWGESATAATINPTHFVQKALEEWGDEGLSRMRTRLIRRTGWKR